MNDIINLWNGMLQNKVSLPMISLLISVVTIIISYLNRKDSIRPYLFVYLSDTRSDEGKITNENIVIENMGSYPAKINDINVICRKNVYTNNGQYDFYDLTEPSTLHYISLKEVLNNKLKGRTILPGKDKRICINMRNLSATRKDILDSRTPYDKAERHRIETLQSLDCQLKITLNYIKPVKNNLVPFINNQYKETFTII